MSNVVLLFPVGAIRLQYNPLDHSSYVSMVSSCYMVPPPACRSVYVISWQRLGSFNRALQFGNQYIYQAMPRMLSLWLDFGAKVYEVEKGGWWGTLSWPLRNDLCIVCRVLWEITFAFAILKRYSKWCLSLWCVLHPCPFVCPFFIDLTLVSFVFLF